MYRVSLMSYWKNFISETLRIKSSCQVAYNIVTLSIESLLSDTRNIHSFDFIYFLFCCQHGYSAKKKEFVHSGV
jgi:hypothetical protein